jgi:hypothetical protein
MRGRFLEAILQRAERKLAGPGRPGTVDRLVAKVERREAPRPTSLGARGRLAARGGYVNPASKGATLLRPGASRRSTPSRGSRGTGKPRTHCAARMQTLGCLKSESPPSRPGRDAALFALLRRTGTVSNTGVRYGPGSAAHRFASATRCAASGARIVVVAGLQRMLPERNIGRTFSGQPGRLLHAPLFSHTPP